jgi:cytochrome c peroxidase
MSGVKGPTYIVCLSILFSLCLTFSIVYANPEQNVDNTLLFGPGDRKQGYDSEDYRTNSVSLDRRIGKEADLLAIANSKHLGLPALEVPADNALSAAKIELGRMLFFDRRLSSNDTFSCAICHIPEQGFTNNEISTAVGVEGRSVKRNSPSLYNVGFYEKLFQDGREDTLEQQAWSPLLARNEMDNPSFGYVIRKIKGIKEYKGRFEQAFDGETVTIATVSKALASYQRTLISANSPFDRWYYGKQENALNAEEKAGFNLFAGKAQCVQCHTIGSEDAFFTDNKTHNTGHGYASSMGQNELTTRVQLAPGVFVDVPREIIAEVDLKKKENDVGLYQVTQNPFDRWKYRTATLRNIELTAPYMHDGAFGTLREVIEFYNQGGIENELLSPLIKPLGLSSLEIDQLAAFLRSLTGDNVDILVADAFAAPIGDLRASDPNWAHDSEYTP